MNRRKYGSQNIWSSVLSNNGIGSGFSLKHIPIITGKFVLAIHWIGEGYQISSHGSV